MENTSAAYGVYSADVDIAEVVRALNGAGFENEHICVMLAPTHPIAEIVRSAGILTTRVENNSATEGWIGWLSRLGAVVIPAVGFFIRSRVFFNALLVSRGAPTLCGNSRTLLGLGFPDTDADRLEEQLAQTGFLVYVRSPELAQSRWVIELLRATGAEETATLEIVADAGAFA
jgi:hypothetical protein